MRRPRKRRHHHQIPGDKIRIERGTSPPKIRWEDQDREGSIITKYQVTRSGERREHHHQRSGQKIRIDKGALLPNIRSEDQD